MKITFHAAAAIRRGDMVLMDLWGVMTAHRVTAVVEVDGYAEIHIAAEFGPDLIRLLPGAAFVPCVDGPDNA